jgi:hypothetical protein
LEDLIEIEKRRAGKDHSRADAPMHFSEASRLLNSAISVLRTLGWAWRWAEWWVDYDSSWEPLLEPGQRESRMTKDELKIVESTRESRCEDARKCRLAAFGAALRNRAYDIVDDEFNEIAFSQALRAILHTKSLIGPLEPHEIDFYVDWLGRAYRTKSGLLFLGEDKNRVSKESFFCVHSADKSPKYELGTRPLPGAQDLSDGSVFENVHEPDDFMVWGLNFSPKKGVRSKAVTKKVLPKKALIIQQPSRDDACYSAASAVAALAPSAVKKRIGRPSTNRFNDDTTNSTTSDSRISHGRLVTEGADAAEPAPAAEGSKITCHRTKRGRKGNYDYVSGGHSIDGSQQSSVAPIVEPSSQQIAGSSRNKQLLNHGATTSAIIIAVDSEQCSDTPRSIRTLKRRRVAVYDGEKSETDPSELAPENEFAKSDAALEIHDKQEESNLFINNDSELSKFDMVKQRRRKATHPLNVKASTSSKSYDFGSTPPARSSPRKGNYSGRAKLNLRRKQAEDFGKELEERKVEAAESDIVAVIAENDSLPVIQLITAEDARPLEKSAKGSKKRRLSTLDGAQLSQDEFPVEQKGDSFQLPPSASCYSSENDGEERVASKQKVEIEDSPKRRGRCRGKKDAADSWR